MGADDQITHELSLDDDFDLEEGLDFFTFDPDFKENEAKFLEVKREIIGDDDDDDESDEEDDEEAEGDGIAGFGGSELISDMTEQDLDECAHKLMKLQIRPGQEEEICTMVIECCAQERTYLRFYGSLGERFCMIKNEYQ